MLQAMGMSRIPDPEGSQGTQGGTEGSGDDAGESEYWASAWLEAHGLLVLLAPFMAVAAYAFLRRVPGIGLAIDRAALAVPPNDLLMKAEEEVQAARKAYKEICEGD